jgi:hypothetical protein
MNYKLLEKRVYEMEFIYVFIHFFFSLRRRILRKYMAQLRKLTYGDEGITMSFINYIIKQVTMKDVKAGRMRWLAQPV